MLGILQEEGECKTQYLRHLGVGYDIIDTLNKLEKDGYIKIKRPNYSLRLHSLTDLGEEYLEQVALIYDTTTTELRKTETAPAKGK